MQKKKKNRTPTFHRLSQAENFWLIVDGINQVCSYGEEWVWISGKISKKRSLWKIGTNRFLKKKPKQQIVLPNVLYNWSRGTSTTKTKPVVAEKYAFEYREEALFGGVGLARFWWRDYLQGFVLKSSCTKLTCSIETLIDVIKFVVTEKAMLNVVLNWNETHFSESVYYQCSDAGN